MVVVVVLLSLALESALMTEFEFSHLNQSLVAGAAYLHHFHDPLRELDLLVYLARKARGKVRWRDLERGVKHVILSYLIDLQDLFTRCHNA